MCGVCVLLSVHQNLLEVMVAYCMCVHIVLVGDVEQCGTSETTEQCRASETTEQCRASETTEQCRASETTHLLCMCIEGGRTLHHNTYI